MEGVRQREVRSKAAPHTRKQRFVSELVPALPHLLRRQNTGIDVASNNISLTAIYDATYDLRSVKRLLNMQVAEVLSDLTSLQVCVCRHRSLSYSTRNPD